MCILCALCVENSTEPQKTQNFTEFHRKFYFQIKFPIWEKNLFSPPEYNIEMERIFAKSTLREFWEEYPDAEQHLKTWYDTAKSADWKTPTDVKQTYSTASILKNSRIVFNIKGNFYRLIAKFNFEKQWIFIRFIGTHIEYDKIDANSI